MGRIVKMDIGQYSNWLNSFFHKKVEYLESKWNENKNQGANIVSSTLKKNTQRKDISDNQQEIIRPKITSKRKPYSSNLMSTKLLIFGGEGGHSEFLGCLNCSEYDPKSICNEYGEYGGEYSRLSIWNEYSTYGGKYSQSGVWNKYSSSNSLPVVVDSSGNFYGYLSINKYKSKTSKYSNIMDAFFERAQGNLKIVRELFCEAMN